MAIKRQEVVDNLKTRLELILVSGGYYTNAGDNVFLHKPIPFDASELPGLNIKDMEEEFVPSTTNLKNVWTHPLRVEIEFACLSGADTTARQIIADIQRALNVDRTLSGKAIEIIWLGDRFKVEKEERLVCGGWVDIIIQYRTNWWEES